MWSTLALRTSAMCTIRAPRTTRLRCPEDSSAAVAIFVCGARLPASAGQVAGGSIRTVIATPKRTALLGGDNATEAAPIAAVVTTGRDGSYRVSNIAPASYTVSAELPGFAKLVRESVVVREGVNLELHLTMTVGDITEVVDVPGDPPMLESKTALKAVNISGSFQRSLPSSALRTWADALTVVPGVVVTQARFQTYFLYGTQHPSGVALIDGADATSVLQGSTLYAQFGRDTFSDVQVKTGGVDAATPLGLGTVTTVATESVPTDSGAARDSRTNPKLECRQHARWPEPDHLYEPGRFFAGRPDCPRSGLVFRQRAYVAQRDRKPAIIAADLVPARSGARVFATRQPVGQPDWLHQRHVAPVAKPPTARILQPRRDNVRAGSSRTRPGCSATSSRADLAPTRDGRPHGATSC